VSVDDHVIAGLLDDMEEYWDAFEHYPLYLLTWGQGRGSEPATELMLARARRALDAFRAAHPARLVWAHSPAQLEPNRPVEPGGTLVLDRAPDSDEPMMVLVPA
jgi:hypothetical protein